MHNIRIERLWVDVTSGFGKKWKEFFHHLEIYHSLNIHSDLHIWLLHHLFLSRINQDIKDWISAWNYHTMSSQTNTHQTPAAMYMQGMLENGIRGVFPELEVQGDGDDAYAAYGTWFTL